MSTNNINIEAVNSANVRIGNARTPEGYTIAANFNVSGSKTLSMESGSVTKEGKQKASFSAMNPTSMKIQFYDVEPQEQQTILSDVNAFITGAKEAISSNLINTDSVISIAKA